jgi:hypothetical protein
MLKSKLPPGAQLGFRVVEGPEPLAVEVDFTEEIFVEVVFGSVVLVVFVLCFASALEEKSNARIITRPTKDIAETIAMEER